MSDSYLRLIPEDPVFVPDPGVLQSARDLFDRIVSDAEEITTAVHDDPLFVDAGENSERVGCPLCDADLSEQWRGQAMEAAGRQSFRDLRVVTPCCRERVSLNDLRYEWPAGFARLVLEARNPNVTRLDDDDLLALEAVVGVPLRIIWARY